MKNSLIIALFFLLIFSCNKGDSQAKLITIAKKCIDSHEVKENFVHVYENEYEFFLLYYIYGSDIATINYYVDTTLTPTHVTKYGDKLILLYEIGKKGLSIDKTHALMNNVSDSLSTTNWFYLVDKRTKDGILIKNEDDRVAAFDVSLIRDRVNKKSQKDMSCIDIAVSDIWFNASSMNKPSLTDTHLFPYKINVSFTVYDRKSCNTFNTPLDSLGKFVLLGKQDTLVINTNINFEERYSDYVETPKQEIKEIISNSYYVHNKNWDICGFYSGGSVDNESFFKKIPQQNFYYNLYRALRDSLYYIPNVAACKKYFKKGCDYPTERIRVFFSPNKWYTFYDPPKTQFFRQGILENEESLYLP